MGLRDDDAQIFADRDLLDWARSAPQSPGDYDHAASEEAQAAYDYDRRKWMEEKPRTYSGYDGDVPHGIGGYSGGSSTPTRINPVKKAPAKKAVSLEKYGKLLKKKMTAVTKKKKAAIKKRKR